MDYLSLLESIKSDIDDPFHDLPDLIYFNNIKQEETVEYIVADKDSNVISLKDVKEEGSSIYNEALVKIKTTPTKNDFEEGQDIQIKKKELDIKEDLQETETSSPPICQNNQGQCKRNSQFDKDTSLNSNLWRKIPKIDHCSDENGSHNNSDEVEMFKCNKCDYQTSQKSSLMSHLHRHNPEDVRKFKCDYCPFKTFFKQHHLNRHLLKHNNPVRVEIFKCSKCDFETIYNHSLKRHQVQHEVDQFKCTKCDFQTVDKDGFERHQLQHDNPEKVLKIFKCNQCSYQTFLKFHLNQHILLHSNT